MNLRRISSRSKIAALAVWATLGLLSAKTVTLDELNEILGHALAAHRSDEDTARRIAELELSERITEDRFAILQSRAPGPRTAATLEELMDQSAFLMPPQAALSPDPPPAIAEQKKIFDRVSTYLLNYARRLPNLICRERIVRYDDDPKRPNTSGRVLGKLGFMDTLVAQVTYAKNSEEIAIQSRDGKPYKQSSDLLGLTTEGEFGNAILVLMLPSTAAKARWSHWEVVHGKRVAVFTYSVAAANSQYTVFYCCQNGRKQSVTAAYQGFLFIEPETGAVVRMTRTVTGLAADFPTRQSNTSIDYGPVSIGGATYLCPVRSVTESENLLWDGRRGYNVHLHSLNEIRYSAYRKFEAESKIMADQSDVPDRRATPAGGGPPPSTTAAATTTRPAAEAETPAAANGESVQPASAQPSQSVYALPAAPPFRELAHPDAGGTEIDAGYSEHATFRERVNIVTVPVVVRDSNGKVVKHLTKDDFELWDNGKRQVISNFAEQDTQPDEPTARAPVSTTPGKSAAKLPDRYVAYIFDDTHLEFADLSQVRSAAEKALKNLSDAGTRIAILTTSGHVRLNFTAEYGKIAAALNRLRPNPVAASNSTCPVVGYFQADRIVNGGDTNALAVAAQDAIADCGVDKRDMSTAQNMGMAAARQSLSVHDYETRATLEGLRSAARAMAVLPGERTILFLSPGFFVPDSMPGLQDLIDRAARSGVVIDALDARGLNTDAGFDAGRKKAATGYERQEDIQQRGALSEIADATGGRIFRNSNDYEAGLRLLSERPGTVYLLAFSPMDSKGKDAYHKLKVTIRQPKGLEIQARHGYLARKTGTDAAQEAKVEVENALLSRDDMQDIPIKVNSAIVNSPAGTRTLDLRIQVDATRIQFQKADGHNRNKLELTFGLFDENGSVVSVMSQEFALNLEDKELAIRQSDGLRLRSDLKLEPACQFLRIVLRDQDGQMTTANEAIR